MIKKINPKCLRNNLWRPGPYMLFFTGNNKYINSEVVNNIYEISKKYKLISVLEVDWDEYDHYEGNASSDGMANVLIYFKGNLEISEKYPDAHKIEELFDKCEIFYKIAFKEHNEKQIQIQKNSDSKKIEKRLKVQKTLNKEQRIHILYRQSIYRRKKEKNIYNSKVAHNSRSHNYNLINSKTDNQIPLSDFNFIKNDINEISQNFNLINPEKFKKLENKNRIINPHYTKNYFQLNSTTNKKNIVFNKFNNEFYNKYDYFQHSQKSFISNLYDNFEKKGILYKNRSSDFKNFITNDKTHINSSENIYNDEKLTLDINPNCYINEILYDGINYNNSKNTTNATPSIKNQQMNFYNQLSFADNDNYLKTDLSIPYLTIENDVSIISNEQKSNTNISNNQVNLYQTQLPHMLFSNQSFNYEQPLPNSKKL